MKVLLFGVKSECVDIISKICQLNNSNPHSFVHTNDTDRFLEMLISEKPHLIIVLSNGACGMERVITARNICVDTPLFWVSDDKNFGVQSYRLKCDYFLVKPVTPEKLAKAFEVLGTKQ